MPALPQSKVDWTVPQPSYEELHAKLDALTTERNAAVAEAKLWLRRTLHIQQECDRLRSIVRDAHEVVETWEAAHAELLRDYRRLEVLANALRFDYESAEAAVRFTQALITLPQ